MNVFIFMARLRSDPIPVYYQPYTVRFVQLILSIFFFY